MARDGSGDYSRVVTPPVNGDVANATDFNAEINDIGAALSDSINKAGTKAFAANQSMGGFILTGLGAGTTSGHSVRYEQMNSAISAYAQPLDATLTAFAALSWASGNPLVQFTAADTISLTLTPSVSSVTASQGAANTTPSGTFTNTTDNASVLAAVFAGARGTSTAGDILDVEMRMNNASGAQKVTARFRTILTNNGAGTETSTLRVGVISAGSVVLPLEMTPTKLGPAANDGAALGSSAVSWADLFLATGGVLNFGAGNATITHSTGLLASNVPIQARIPLSSEASGTLTVVSANKKILASGGITLPNSVFAAEDEILIDGNGTARTITRGSGVTMYVGGVDSATATLTANGIMAVHWRTASICILTGNVS